MSARNSSVQLNPNSKLRQERRTRVFFVVIILLLVVVAVVIGFLRKKEFQINDVTVSGTEMLSSFEIRDQSLLFMKGAYAWVVPKTNALLFSKSALRKNLLATFPGMADASIEFSERNVIHVNVSEKKPAFVWCRDEQCWFVDHAGIIYDDAPVFSDGVFVRFSGMAPGNTIPEDPRRARFASQDQFNQTVQMIGELGQYPMIITGVQYLEQGALFDAQPTGQGDIALQVATIKGIPVGSQSVILMTDHTTAESFLRSLELVMTEDKFLESLKTQGRSLQYIDLRFDGKIYYKFGN